MSLLYHQVLARALRDAGADTVFGLLGDANLFAMREFDQLEGCCFVSVAHEASALLAANGYHRTSGRLGVATVTHGPGLANTVTSLIEATKDRAPLVLIAGDTATLDRDGFQNVAQREIVMATGAGFEQARSTTTVAADVSRAVRRALVERRPVVLNIPVDLQWQEAEEGTSTAGLALQQATAPDPEALDRAAGIIASSRRPVILAGRGATSPAARTALLALSQRIGAPLSTSLRGKDLFRGEPHDVGLCGASAGEHSQQTYSAADCVIAFGAALNRWTTVEGALLTNRAVVQVDIDAASIGRNYAVTTGVVGDAEAVARALDSMLAEAAVEPTGFAAEVARTAPVPELPRRRSGGAPGTVDIQQAVFEIDRLFSTDRTLVLDGGRFAMSVFDAVHVPSPAAYVHTQNFLSIGLGMGTAIGAARGADRPVLLISGDGGFMLGGLYEFSTAVRHGLNLTVVVLNDGGYGAEHVQLRGRGLEPHLSLFDWPALGPVATSLGGRGFEVHDLEDLRDALTIASQPGPPTLINVHLDPDEVPIGGYLIGPAV